MRIFHTTILLASLITSFSTYSESKTPNSIIKMIIDGGGINHFNYLKRYYRKIYGKPSQLELLMNEGQLHIVDTRAANTLIPDSAQTASQTELGVPAHVDVIGIGAKGETKNTLEIALAKGMSVGTISNMDITHATPAAVYAHDISRANNSAIAMDAVESGISLAMGGGRGFFLPQTDKGSFRKDNLNLIDQLKKKKYRIVENLSQLDQLPNNSKKVFGLFSKGHMSVSIGPHIKSEPTLTQMVQKSLKILSQNKKGFYLAIEEGRNDYGGHANDPGWVINQLLEADKVIGVIRKYLEKNPKTLFLLTADHETGGMSIFSDYHTKNQSQENQAQSIKGAPTRAALDFIIDGNIFKFIQKQNRTFEQISSLGLGDPNELAELLKKHVHPDVNFNKISMGQDYLKWLSLAPYLYSSEVNGILKFSGLAESVRHYGFTGGISQISQEEFIKTVRKHSPKKLRLSSIDAIKIITMEKFFINASRHGGRTRLSAALKNLGYLNIAFGTDQHTASPVYLITNGPGKKLDKKFIRQHEIGIHIQNLIKQK